MISLVSERSPRSNDRLTLLAFLVMVVGIGGNVIGVKYVLREPGLDPMWAAAMRFFVAAALFALIGAFLRIQWPRRRALAGAVLYGGLTFGAFFAFAYWGLLEAPAGVAGALFATVPLITYLLALAHRIEKFGWLKLTGAILAVVGTALILRSGLDSDIPALSLLAIVAAAACAAEGAIVVKIFPKVHPVAMNTIGMATGTIMFLVLMPLFGEDYVIPSAPVSWLAQVYLVVVGSMGVFALYLFVLSRWTASAASYEFVLAPVVAVILAVWLLDEEITAAFILGASIVLLGVYVGAIRRPRGGDPGTIREPGAF